MSWAALPVEPACMGKAVGEAGRPLMLCGARLYIIAFNNSKNYYCKDTHCIDVDRKDDIDVIYKEVKRS